MLKQPNKSCFFQTTSIVKIVLSTLSIKPPFFKVPSIKSIISLDKKIIIVVILATGNEHDLVRNIDGALRRLEPDDDRSPPRDRRRSSRHHSQVSLSVSAKKLRKRKVQTCKNSTASGCLKFEMWDCCHELLSKGSGQHRSMDFC